MLDLFYIDLLEIVQCACFEIVRHYVVLVFSWDQAALWMVQSVRPSVWHSFFTMFPSSYHHGIIISYSQGQKWCPCKRSTAEIKGQGYRGQNKLSPNLGVSGTLQFEFTDTYEMMHKAWIGIEAVPYYFSRSSVKFQGHTGRTIDDFDPNLAYPDCNSSFNSWTA